MSRMPLDFSALQSVSHWLQGFSRPWFIAGGWALDAFLKRLTREHLDLEIAIFREDQLELQQYLQDWQFEKVVSGQLLPWKEGEYLSLPIHEIHGQRGPDKIEILLNERYGDRWVYRRHLGVTRELHKSGHLSSISGFFSDGLPILAPEIVLLYKSKAPREKDAQDFFNVQSVLPTESRHWLKHALEIIDAMHPWIKHLD